MEGENGQAAGGSAQAGTPPDGSLDAAINAELEALEQGQGTDEGEQQADENQGDDAPQDDEGNETDEQDEGEEQAPTAGENEVVFDSPDGKKYVVPRELAQGYMRGADYTQKTMQHAEYVRQHDAQLQELYRGGQQFQAQRAQMYELNASIEQGFQYLAANPTLATTDAVEFSRISGQIAMLQHAQRQVEQQMRQSEQQFSAYEQQQMQRRIAEVAPRLAAAGIGPQELGLAEQWARKSGFSAEEMAYLNAANSPHAIVALNKARLYDDLMAQRAKASTKVNQAKRSAVLTPGNASANTPQTRPGNNVARTRQRVAATGSVSDAIAHELALMNRAERGQSRRR